MSDLKKILVVDDRYEMLEFLRSSLNLSSEDYELEAVPSAEEGLLEIRRAKFDLLVTEVRLPGMSGFDLVRRMRRLKPELPAIMVADYSSEQGQQEAADLGVKYYFQKPLDTDDVLAAVNSSLFGDLVIYADDPEAPEPADIDVPQAAQERLETLRADMAASRIILATSSGRILSQTGRGQGIDLPKLTTLIAQNLANSKRIAEEVGGVTLNTIQYHAGSGIELYVASGGVDYFLAIFFDGQARRGRMGTIWVFAQRAVKDLLTILPVLNASHPQAVSPAAVSASDVDAAHEPSMPSEPAGELEIQADIRESTPPFKEVDVPADPAAPPSELQAPTEADGFFMLDERTAQDSSDIDAFWESAASEGSTVGQTEGALSFEQAKEKGLVPGGSEPTQVQFTEQPGDASEREPVEMPALFALEGETADVSELDDFWGDALADYDSSSEEKGLSFEEAMREGLIPQQMESEDAAVADSEQNQEAEED